MTKKEMITKCVENQIERGIIEEKDKQYHINYRLKGSFSMTKTDAQRWYNEVFGK